MTIDIKKTLLTGTALVAVGAFAVPQGASAQEIENDAGNANNVTGSVDPDTPITNNTDNNAAAPDFGEVNADGGLTVGDADGGSGSSITQDTSVDGTLFIFDDNASDTDANTLTLDPAGSGVSVDAVTSTLNLQIGENEAGDAGTQNNVNVTFTDNITSGGGDVNIDALANAESNLTFQGDTINLSSGTITLNNAGDVLAFDRGGAQTLDGNITNNNGTLRLENTLTLNSGTVELANTGDGLVVLGSSITGGSTVIDESGGGSVSITNNIDVEPNASYTSGTITLFQGAGRSASINSVIDSAFANFSATNNGGNTEISVDSINSTSTVASDLSTSKTRASVLLDAATGGNSAAPSDLVTALEDSENGGSAADDAADQINNSTAVAASVTTAAQGASRTSASNINTRLASHRDARTGIAAGNGRSRQNAWARFSGGTLDQDAREGQSGYESDSYGGTIGYDRSLTGDAHLGLAFTYNFTDTESNGADQTESEVDTYLLSVYGDRQFGQAFVNGAVRFGYNDGEVDKVLSGVSKSGDYSTEQYGASVEGGYDYRVNEQTTLTPSAGLNYTRMEGDSYTVNGTGGSAEDVEFDDKDSLIAKIGGSAQGEYDTHNGGKFVPEIHGNFMYDLAADELEVTRTFSNGATVNGEQADIDESAWNVGASFDYELPDQRSTISLGYDAELKDEFDSHTGQVKFSYKF